MPQSRFKEIYDAIREGIEDGSYPYQSLLPSESDLCKRHDCSRSTVRRALSELALDGYAQPIQGKGVRVIWRRETDEEIPYAMGGLESFDDVARRLRFEARSEVRGFEELEVGERLARVTGFAVGERIWRIDRVRLANGTPISIETSYLLQAEAPGLTREAAGHSLYHYIEDVVGGSIATGKRTITVEAATDDDLAVFGPLEPPAVGVMRGQHFDTNGVMFEYSEIRQHPSYFSVREVTTRPTPKG